MIAAPTRIFLLILAAALLPYMIVLLFVLYIHAFELVQELQALFYPIIVLSVAVGVYCVTSLPIPGGAAKAIIALAYIAIMATSAWLVGFKAACLIGGHCA